MIFARIQGPPKTLELVPTLKNHSHWDLFSPTLEGEGGTRSMDCLSRVLAQQGIYTKPPGCPPGRRTRGQTLPIRNPSLVRKLRSPRAPTKPATHGTHTHTHNLWLSVGFSSNHLQNGYPRRTTEYVFKFPGSRRFAGFTHRLHLWLNE